MKKIILNLPLLLMSIAANASVIDNDIQKGQLEEAHKIVENEIAKNPNEAGSWLAYAKLMLAQNDSQKSWAGLSQARKIIQSLDTTSDKTKAFEHEYHQIEGMLYFQKKSFDKAAQSFSQALKYNNQDLNTQLWLSCAWLAESNLSQAMPIIAKMYATSPKNEAVLFLYQLTHPSEKELQNLIKNQPDLMAPRIALIEQYMKKKQYNTAQKVIDKSPEKMANQLTFLMLSSQISLHLKQPNAVIEKLKAMGKINEDYRLLGLLSIAYSSVGNFNQASTLFEKSLKSKEYKIPETQQTSVMQLMRQPVLYIDQLLVNDYYQKQFDNASSGLVKIAYFYKQNKLADARQEARNWLQIFPGEAFSYDVLGSVNKVEGDYPSAENAFKSAIKLNETYLPARLHLIDVLIKQRKYQEARKLLLDTSKKFKPDSNIFLLWSKLEEFEGNRDAAKKWLEKAANIEQNLEPGLEFVSFYLRQNRPQLALHLAENLAKMHGNDIRLLTLLGGLYLEKPSHYPLALEIFEKLAQFTPDSPGVAQNLSKAHLLVGHPEKAVAVLEQYILKYPDHLEVERQLARLYIHNRNYDKAKLSFEKILKNHPDDYVSLNNLASLYIELNAQKSLAFAKQAYEHAPNNPAVCDTLGWSYYKNNDIRHALTYLLKANKLDPNLADATYHLALVYREQGQKQAAVAFLKQALASTDPQFSARAQANTLLKNWSS